MSNVKEKMTAIADAIRAKTGGTDALGLDDMASEIEKLSLGELDTTVTEFSVMNDKVTAYLEAADAAYTDDNGDSVTVMEDYQTAEGNKDRPLGHGISAGAGSVVYLQNEDSGGGWKQAVNTTSHTIYNAIPGKISQYLVKTDSGSLVSGGRLKPTGRVRMLYFDYAARNSRDLGGWACDGGTVKYGLLYRGENVGSSITEDDIKRAADLGIGVEVDIRSEATQTVSLFGENVRYVNIPISLYYANLIDQAGSEFENVKLALRELMDAAVYQTPAYFHCALGRDRAGVLAFLLLALLGVCRADIDKDYELSSFSPQDQPTPRTRSDYRQMATYLATFGGETLRDNVVWWFIKAGFNLTELNAFRGAMIEGSPEELTAEAFSETRSITNTLTNCTTSNSATSVPLDGSYSATITANSGYALDSITVTMGGTDITSTAVSGSTISIASVTGNIVITATAVEEAPAYTNQLDVVGYESGRLGSAGTNSSSTAHVRTTGYIPCKAGDVIRFANITFNSTLDTNCRISFYDASNTHLRQINNKMICDSSMAAYAYYSPVLDSDGNLVQFTIPSADNTTDLSTVAYFRFCTVSGGMTDASIVTVNEEIG